MYIIYFLMLLIIRKEEKFMGSYVEMNDTLQITKEQTLHALEEMHLDASVRGEALTLSQFAMLSNIICF